MTELFAEDARYFQTSRSAPDTWIERACELIADLGGEVRGHAYGMGLNGRGSFMLAFEIGGEPYKVVWPVLPAQYSKNERAAKVQAATMLYHDIKAKCISAQVLGTRAAFFSYLLLPDGRTAAEVSTPELSEAIPVLFAPRNPLLMSGER